MARGRARYQRGWVVATRGGGWELHYNIYLTDPTAGKPKRTAAALWATSRRCTGATPRRSWPRNWLPSMAVQSPERQTELSHLEIGCGISTSPCAAATGGTRRTNLDYLNSHVYPALEQVALKDVTKFQVQMLLNRLAAEEYSYTVVYHVRDLIKAGLAEAVDQEVLERSVARKTVIPEIEESDKPVLRVEMYAKLLAGLDGIRDRAIFLIACFCALRPSELFGLTWGCYNSNVFTIVNTAWRGRLQRKKIKRKDRYGRTNYRLVAIPQAVRKAIDLWRGQCPNPNASALMFPGMQARARKPLATPIHPDNWLRLRLYPVAKRLGMAFHPNVPGAPEKLLDAWQEGSTPDRDAGPTRTQRHSYHPGHLYADYRPGSGQNGKPGHKPHPGLGWGG